MSAQKRPFQPHHIQAAAWYEAIYRLSLLDAQGISLASRPPPCTSFPLRLTLPEICSSSVAALLGHWTLDDVRAIVQPTLETYTLTCLPRWLHGSTMERWYPHESIMSGTQGEHPPLMTASP